MILTIVVVASVRDAANALTATRDGGETFTAALALPASPTVPTAYWTSWDTAGYVGTRWANAGVFDLRDELEGHPWLAGKVRIAFDGDNTITVIRLAARIAKIYRNWNPDLVLTDLGLVRLQGPPL